MRHWTQASFRSQMRMRRSSPPAAKVRSSNQHSALTERRCPGFPSASTGREATCPLNSRRPHCGPANMRPPDDRPVKTPNDTRFPCGPLQTGPRPILRLHPMSKCGCAHRRLCCRWRTSPAIREATEGFRHGAASPCCPAPGWPLPHGSPATCPPHMKNAPDAGPGFGHRFAALPLAQYAIRASAVAALDHKRSAIVTSVKFT